MILVADLRFCSAPYVTSTAAPLLHAASKSPAGPSPTSSASSAGTVSPANTGNDIWSWQTFVKASRCFRSVKERHPGDVKSAYAEAKESLAKYVRTGAGEADLEDDSCQVVTVDLDGTARISEDSSCICRC